MGISVRQPSTPARTIAMRPKEVVWRDRRVKAGPIKVSVVILTYCRDDMVPSVISQAALVAAGRQDIECILVDNNPDDVDRLQFLEPFDCACWVRVGQNEGVSARNHGTQIARGEFILYIDDDSLLYPLDALGIFEGDFDNNPRLAIINARYVDQLTGETSNGQFPHPDKRLDKSKAHLIFRFQGSGHMLRRCVSESVGLLSTDYFYGYEEMDYAYRVVSAGYEILYEPRCWVVEHNHPGGRQASGAVMRMRLRNKLINSYKHLPAPYFQINFFLFPLFLLVQQRGKVNVAAGIADFFVWQRTNRHCRRPLSRAGVEYIRRCGGALWR